MKNGRTAAGATAGWSILKAVAAAWLRGCRRVHEAGDVKPLALSGGGTMEMVRCPSGTFPMENPDTEGGRYEDETQHPVAPTTGFGRVQP